MKRVFSFALAAALMMAAACSEPLNEVAEEATPQNEAVATTTDGRTVADVNMERFAEILSKAVAQSRDLRVFFKNEAQKKIDNDYNVFYPISKRKAVGGETMEQMLAKYANESELAEIQATVPLLNVHLPELAGSTVADLDTDDEELPVLYNNVMYYDGEPIDTLAADEVPGFNILVVTESTSIRKKSGLSKSASDLSIDDEYEYVSASCKPEPKSLSKVAEYENAGAMYYNNGLFPKSKLCYELQNAYDIAKSNKFAVRTAMYYNWKSLNDKKTDVNLNIHERIFRIKLDSRFLERYYDELTCKNGESKMFDNSTSKKKGEMERTEVINNLVNGRMFEFKFVIVTPNGNTGTQYPKTMTILVKAQDLFDFKVNTDKRHKTKFRHSKYTYTFVKGGTKSKWVYLNKYSSDIDRWQIEKGMYQKYISVYLCDPKAGSTKTISQSLTSGRSIGWSIQANLSAKVSEMLSWGISGSLNGTKTTSVTNNVSYSTTFNDRLLGSFTVDFFTDPIIQSISSNNQVTLPEYKVGDELWISILPDRYY